MPKVVEAKKIVVGPLPADIRVNVPVTLIVLRNGARGHIDAKVKLSVVFCPSFRTNSDKQSMITLARSHCIPN